MLNLQDTTLSQNSPFHKKKKKKEKKRKEKRLNFILYPDDVPLNGPDANSHSRPEYK